MQTILSRIAIAAPVLGKHACTVHVLAVPGHIIHILHYFIARTILIPHCVVIVCSFSGCDNGATGETSENGQFIDNTTSKPCFTGY